MISKVLIVLAALSVSVLDAMEEKCYSVGNCSPEEEPTGTTEEKCRTFEKSLQCMREALDACRQLPNLPTEFVATVEEVLSEMKNELDMRCSGDQVSLNDEPSAGKSKDSDMNGGGRHQSSPVLVAMATGAVLMTRTWSRVLPCLT